MHAPRAPLCALQHNGGKKMEKMPRGILIFTLRIRGYAVCIRAKKNKNDTSYKTFLIATARESSTFTLEEFLISQ